MRTTLKSLAFWASGFQLFASFVAVSAWTRDQDATEEVQDRLLRSVLPISAIENDESVQMASGFCPNARLSPKNPCVKPVTDPRHPLVQYVQAWVNRLDALLRQSDPESLRAIPAPKVVLNPSDSFNAGSLGSEQCFKVAVEPGFALDHDPISIPKKSVEIRGRGVLTHTSTIAYFQCDAPRPGELERLVRLFNRNSTGCALELAQGGLRYSKPCIDPMYMTEAVRSDILRVNTQSDVISINRGVFTRSPSELHFISVIAHELGHYYSNHGAALLERPSFYYSDLRTGAGNRRVPAPELEALADGFFGYETYPVHAPRFRRQRWHPLSFLFFEIASADSCAESDSACRKECGKAARFIEAKISQAAQGVYPGSLSGLPATYERDYLEAETRVRRCLAGIPFTVENSWAISDITRRDDLYWFAELGLGEAQGKTMSDWMDDFSRRLDEVEVRWDQIYRKQMQVHLGKYTVEQQADELSAWYFFLLGLRPELASLPYENALQSSNRDSWLSWNWEACVESMKNGWRDPVTGLTGWVPVGSFVDAHHSLCFRIFSVREEARRLSSQGTTGSGAGTPPSLLKQPEWEKFQELARDL